MPIKDENRKPLSELEGAETVPLNPAPQYWTLGVLAVLVLSTLAFGAVTWAGYSPF